MYTQMVKNIAIMDSVYDELVRRKRDDESFSNEIKRLISKKGSILEFAGSWKISENEANEIKKKILETRKGSTKKILERVNYDRS